MDGNGRWAKRRRLPRIAGHRRGVEVVKDLAKACIERRVENLTLFAFSSENWRRPPSEVSLLLKLFERVLQREVENLHRNNIRIRVIGDTSRFAPILRGLIANAETVTQANTGLTLTVAANYGGRWDIMQAVTRMLAARPDLRASFDEEDAPHFALHDAPEPDLLIRTGGEQRISNFLLWHLAYTELYFTDTLWPDFNAKALDLAIQSFQRRERRFGRTGDQLEADRLGDPPQ